jgi:hypothetical protein
MRIIGRLEDGARLVAFAPTELNALVEWAAIVSASMPIATVLASGPAPAETAARSIPSTKTEIRAVTGAATGKKSEKEKRLCAWCGKGLPAKYSPIAKTHMGECTKLYRRKLGRESWRKNHGVKNPHKNLAEPASAPGPTTERRNALAVNPSDPGLSDAERQAARLAMIKASAEKYRDN